MRELVIRSHLMLATGFLAFSAAGCTEHNRSGASSYCDNTGCYQCDADKRCWPIGNAACGNDSSCPAGSVCTNIGCAKPCGGPSQCSDGETCVTGFCAPGGFTDVHKFVPPTTCKDDTGCKTEEFCDDNGKCAPRCKSDDDCPPDFFCAPCGKCEPKGKPATCGTSQIFCSETIPCGTGKACVNSWCYLKCQTSTNCPIGQICSSGTCTNDPSPAKPACVLNSQCGGGLCINGYCHDACTTSVQCGAGALCQMGFCQPDYSPAK